MIIYFLYGLLLLVSLGAFSLFTNVFRLGVPPMPSSRGMRSAVIEEIGRFTGVRQIVDLGSGWGGLADAVSRAYPGRQVIGYEASLLPYLYSRLRHRNGRTGNLRFIRRDFLRQDPQDQTIYLAYLSPQAMEKLRRHFEAALPRDTALISALFGVRSWHPSRERIARDRQRTKVFVYEIRLVGLR